jgi:general secretion pathway protein N
MNWRLALTGIGLLMLACGAALAVLPARWAMTALPPTWPLAVVDASGTVWSGSATIALGPPELRRTVPEPLRWQVSFAGGPKLRVSHSWLSGPLTLAPKWSGVGISKQSLQVPAAALASLDARMAAIAPEGEISLKWPAIFIGRQGRPAGATLLDIQWRNAASTLTSIRPLGAYALSVKQAATGRAELVLSTLQGPLMLNGTGLLDRNSGFQFDGTAQADPAASANTHAALHDILAALGPRRGDHTLLRFR